MNHVIVRSYEDREIFVTKNGRSGAKLILCDEDFSSYDLTDLEHNATNQINPFQNKSHPSISHNSVMSEFTVLANDPLHN
jgi:hypothetical protein